MKRQSKQQEPKKKKNSSYDVFNMHTDTFTRTALAKEGLMGKPKTRI